MTKKDINSTLAIVAAFAATPGLMSTVPPHRGPSKGNGSGRTAKCKGCGVTGAVEPGPDGKRHIAGCNC